MITTQRTGKGRAFGLVAAGVLLAGAAAAPVARADRADPTAFRYVRDVTVPPAGSGAPVRLQLPPALLAGPGPDSAHLRLLDDRWIEVPFRLVVESGESQAWDRATRLVSLGHDAAGRIEAVLEVADPSSGHDEIEVSLVSPPYFCAGELAGSTDGEAWTDVPLAAPASIGTVAEPATNRLRYPESGVPFLRLRLDCHEPEQVEKLQVRMARNWPAREVRHDARVDREGRREPRLADVLVIRLGAAPVPVSRLVLRSRDGRPFTRAAAVQARPGADEPWRSISRAEFRTAPGAGGSATVSFPEVRAAQLEVILWRGDGPALPPVDLDVLGWGRSVLFRMEAGRSYRMYYGEVAVDAPRYAISPDLAAAPPDLPAATLGPRGPNPRFAEPRDAAPWADLPDWALWGVLTFAALGVGYFLLRALRT